MQFGKLSELIMTTWRDGIRTPFIFLGPPGIGKTALGRHVAEMMTAERQLAQPSAPPALCKVLDLSSMLPEDLIGLPWRNIEDECTDYAGQRWLHECCQPGAYGVVVLDDLPAAAPALAVASRQFILERRIHEHFISDGIIVLVTGNRREDKSAARTLPAHLINSSCMMELKPDLESWCEWYTKQPQHSSDVSSFLRYRPMHLSYLPKEGDKRSGAFATPRTWSKLGRMWDSVHGLGMGFEVAAGLVGEGCATEFVAYVNVKAKLIDPMEVLKDPMKAIPNPSSYLGSPDKCYAMMTGLAEIGYMNKMGLEFLVALGWCSQGNKEYVSASINHWKAVGDGGAMGILIRAIRKAERDPKLAPTIAPVLDWLEKVHGPDNQNQ